MISHITRSLRRKRLRLQPPGCKNVPEWIQTVIKSRALSPEGRPVLEHLKGCDSCQDLASAALGREGLVLLLYGWGGDDPSIIDCRKEAEGVVAAVFSAGTVLSS